MATAKHVYTHPDGRKFKRMPVSTLAKELRSNPNRDYFLVPANVNAFHFFSGWHLAYIPSDERKLQGIEAIAAEMLWHTDRERGRYIVAYGRV